ncbi:conserved hypothetical protein [Desulfosarcina cetonica]|nr:conserved hypothetical protein [Desulfosarcina cetonica]
MGPSPIGKAGWRVMQASGRPECKRSVDPALASLPFPFAQLELLDLAGGCLGQGAKFDGLGSLEACQIGLAELDDRFGGWIRAGFGHHEGLGHLAPFGVGHRYHGHFHDIRMAVEDVFHLDGGDVFPAADDDVFLAVHDLDVVVRVHHRQITAVEPTTGKGRLGGLGVVVVAQHDVVAAHDDLPHGLAVPRHRLHGLRVDHIHVLGDDIGNPLAGLELGPLVIGKAVPLGLPLAYAMGAEHLGQAIGLGNVGADALHVADDGGGRRGAGGHDLQTLFQVQFVLGGVSGHADQNGRGGAQVGDAFLGDDLEDFLGNHLAQADMGGPHGRDAPGEAPAVAVEHGQGPQVNRVCRGAEFQLLAQGVEIGAAVVVHDALGQAGGAAGVVDRGHLALVVDFDGQRIGIALGQEGLIVRAVQRFVVADVADVDDGVHLLQLIHDRGDQFGELIVHEQRLAVRVVDDVGHLVGRQTDIDAHQGRADHGHGVVGLEHGRGVGADEGHLVALGDAFFLQGAGQAVDARVKLAVGPADIAIDHRFLVGKHHGATDDKIYRGENIIVDRGVRHDDSPFKKVVALTYE